MCEPQVFGLQVGPGSAKFSRTGRQAVPGSGLDRSLEGTTEVRTFWNIWQVPCSVFILTELKTFVGISGN